MLEILAIVVGASLVVSVFADMLNTLVTTTRSSWRWWLTRVIYLQTWSLCRLVGRRIRDERRRERFFSLFAPLSLIVMLSAWVLQQIVGFALVWWGFGGVDGVDGFVDALYYSGIVYFTVGFGEVVPVDQIPRFGAVFEAFTGVLTTALVIGYLPALYSAYSEREQKLLTLDDGTEERITPTSLVLSRCPDADPRQLDAFFEDWERWVAQVLESHTTFPMLVVYRSQHRGQSWITALGLVADAALHLELVRGEEGRASTWTLRRSIRLLDSLTEGRDLSSYRAHFDKAYEDQSGFETLYRAMDAHGFDMLPFDEAWERSRELRRRYDAQLEVLIDTLEAPRGFWGHSIGLRVLPDRHAVEGARSPSDQLD